MPKTIRINATYCFVMKIPNRRELQQIASNYSHDFELKDIMKFYKDYTKKPLSFLGNNTTLPSDNTLRFKKNLL